MLPRVALQDIDPNGLADLLQPKAYSAENNISDKLSKGPSAYHASSYVDRDEYHKTCKERDVLVEEVRKLTRELSKLKEPEQASSWQKITASTREMRRMEDEARDLKAQLDDQKELNRRQQEMFGTLTGEKAELQSSLAALRSELSAAMDMRSTMLISLENCKKSLSQATAEMEGMRVQHEEEIKPLTRTIEQLKEDNQSLKERLEKYISSNCDGNAASDSGGAAVDAVVDHAVVKDLQDKLARSEQARKQLQNKVHELRGNVRVFVRCRPFLRGDEELESPESGAAACPAVRCLEEASVISVSGGRAGSAPQTYSYDQVFQDSCGQEKVFDAVSDLIQSALDGYRVCIFAYGQTGSGKTHTMTGTGSSIGIIPRAVDQMVREVISMREGGWQIRLRASMLEVYNEAVRDILSSPADDAAMGGCETNSSENKASAKHRITFLNGKVSVSDVSSFDIDTSTLESGRLCLDEILQRSQKNRTTASTAMNERSSRSHCLFYLDISGYHPGVNTYMEGGLRLVDLAGSERLGRAGTAGDSSRFRETVSINKSLSNLGEVFLALGNKAAHVPYRNSKLTMLLQDCLSGDGKALMFVNISPTSASLQETICSLRFANQVNQVELGQAKKSLFKNAFLPAPALAPAPAPAARAPPAEAEDAAAAPTKSTAATDCRRLNNASLDKAAVCGPSQLEISVLDDSTEEVCLEDGRTTAYKAVRSHHHDYSRTTVPSSGRASILVGSKRSSSVFMSSCSAAAPAGTAAPSSALSGAIHASKRKKIATEKKSSCWR